MCFNLEGIHQRTPALGSRITRVGPGHQRNDIILAKLAVTIEFSEIDRIQPDPSACVEIEPQPGDTDGLPVLLRGIGRGLDGDEHAHADRAPVGGFGWCRSRLRAEQRSLRQGRIISI